MGPKRLRPLQVAWSGLDSLCRALPTAQLPAFLQRLLERVQEGPGSLGGWRGGPVGTAEPGWGAAWQSFWEHHPLPSSSRTPLCPTEDQQLPGLAVSPVGGAGSSERGCPWGLCSLVFLTGCQSAPSSKPLVALQTLIEEPYKLGIFTSLSELRTEAQTSGMAYPRSQVSRAM